MPDPLAWAELGVGLGVAILVLYWKRIDDSQRREEIRESAETRMAELQAEKEVQREAKQRSNDIIEANTAALSEMAGAINRLTEATNLEDRLQQLEAILTRNKNETD